MLSEVKYFQLKKKKKKKGKRLKILTAKQILQRLLIIGKLTKLKLDILCVEQKKLQK